MIETPDYRSATNMAYDVLRALHISSLPVDIRKMIGKLKSVKMISYRDFCIKEKISEFEFFQMGVSSYGFTFKGNGKALILYNESQDESITRFTLAHELGHLYLQHTNESYKSDKEANCFARNILCPIPVSHSWNMMDPNDYVDIFDVSFSMAKVSIEFRDIDFHLISGARYWDTYGGFNLAKLTKQDQLKKYSARVIRDFGDIYHISIKA